MLFQLGYQVNDFADDGIFEPRPEDDVANSAGKAHPKRRQSTLFPFQPPLLCRCRQLVNGAAEIGSESYARCHGGEARQDSVAEILVDAAAVPLDHRHQPRLILPEQSHQFLRRKRPREGGEAAQIGHQYGGAASIASHAFDVFFGPPALCRDLGREEARQMVGRLLLSDRPRLNRPR